MLNNHIIIGVNGKKQSGKSTFANLIKDQYPEQTVILNFADAVKESLKLIFDFSDDELYGDKKETINEYWNITPREAMQYFGTDLMRDGLSKRFGNIGTNIWVMALEKKINNILKTDDYKIIVIADLRFKNEYNLIKKYNGWVVEICKDNVVNNEFSNHQSENDLNGEVFDFSINNDGTKEELKYKMSIVMNNILYFERRHKY